MNYRKNCYQTMGELAEALGLQITDLLDVQADCMRDYVERRNPPHMPFLFDEVELALLYRLPEFRVFVGQVWHNADRSLLAKISRLAPMCVTDMKEWYRLQHRHTLSMCYPSEMVEQAWQRELNNCYRELETLKLLVNAF